MILSKVNDFNKKREIITEVSELKKSTKMK